MNLDLRVMSPTSYLAAPPRDCRMVILCVKLAKSLKEVGYPVLGKPELMKIFGTTRITVIPEADACRLVMKKTTKCISNIRV